MGYIFLTGRWEGHMRGGWWCNVGVRERRMAVWEGNHHTIWRHKKRLRQTEGG